jgi:hypothetical protein
VAASRAGVADCVSLDHVDCLRVVVARCFRHQHAARRTQVHADAAARESREGFQTSIEALSDPPVPPGPLRDQADCVADVWAT